MNLITRLRLAYKAFRMKPFSMVTEGYRETSGAGGHQCDGTWPQYGFCSSGKPPVVCMSRQFIRFEIEEDSDHFHCCEECAKIAKDSGKYDVHKNENKKE